MITEDYVSFETAKLLKEKGFDEPVTELNKLFFKEGEKPVLKITLQKAMKWLREVHNIFIQISAILQDQPFVLHYRPSIQDYNAYARCDNFSEYVTYEEACEAAIKYCLENLI